MVCVAVVLFMLCGTKNRDFDFLEKEPFETEYGVTGMVRERQAAYRPTYDKLAPCCAFCPLFRCLWP